MADQAKVQEVFSDEVFVKNLLALETPEEVQAALQKKGVDLTVEDIVKIRDLIAKKQNAGELSDEDLEGVAGGTFNEFVGEIIIATGEYVSSIGKIISDYIW
ncbi:MAG: Nif11-like leader peptide family natural product precursor [Firmicutes bacterium]|nr:Nif11-like leader peptide family natural product precursor [Bacillota bacterium]